MKLKPESNKAGTVVKIKVFILIKRLNQLISISFLTRFIACEICQGVLKAATAITECLHTCNLVFKAVCKDCIDKKIKESDSCPTCNIKLGPHPEQLLRYNHLIRPDPVLQAVIFKLLPTISDNKNQKHKLAQDVQDKPKHKRQELSQDHNMHKHHGIEDAIPFRIIIDKKWEVNHPISDIIYEEIHNMGFLKVIKTNKVDKSTTIQKIKKNLIKKLGTKDIELFCGESKLGDEWSIDFVKRTLWFQKDSIVLSLRLK
jgi:E3 ubiquitin-protein ligase DRIP